MKRTVLLSGAAAVAMVLAGAIVAFDRPGRAEAALPSDPGIIAFQSHMNPQEDTNPEGDSEIFTMNPDGSGTRQLTVNSANDTEPSLSADGTKITFARDRNGNLDIYKMNSDGSGKQRLTGNQASDSDPTFSPDGKKIVFVSDRGGNNDVYAMNSDGSGTPKNLTNNAADDAQPSVSPDGREIVFVSRRDDASDYYREIYAMNSDGSGQRRLTHDPSAFNTSPDYSADGTKIAFDRQDDVYVMDADGSDPTNVTNGHDVFIGSPSYSTDGTRIAFHTDTDFLDRFGPVMDVYATDADGGGSWTQLTHDPNVASTALPDWQPNSSPAVKPLSPVPGSSTTDRTPYVSARVKDAQEDLAKPDVTRLSLDGQTVARTAFSYDPSTDRLSYTPAADLSYGGHTVRVVARDSAGATTTKGWSFRVASP